MAALYPLRRGGAPGHPLYPIPDAKKSLFIGIALNEHGTFNYITKQTSMYKKIHVLLLILTMATGSYSFAFNNFKTIKWIDGSWTGMKYQVNVDKAWKVNLVCNSKAGTFSIEYPDLNCKGHLELISISGKQACFIEKMNSGLCLDDGYIIITFINERLISFSCLRENKKRLASFCTLEKRNASGS